MSVIITPISVSWFTNLIREVFTTRAKLDEPLDDTIVALPDAILDQFSELDNSLSESVVKNRYLYSERLNTVVKDAYEAWLTSDSDRFYGLDLSQVIAECVSRYFKNTNIA